MNQEVTKTGADSKPRMNPWLIILFTAPIPLMILIFVGVKWYRQRTDFSRITSQFIQRQNSVMAHDALSAAGEFSELLRDMTRDVKVLSLVPVTAGNFRKFRDARFGEYTRYNVNGNAIVKEPRPVYNRIVFMNVRGEATLNLLDDVVSKKPVSLSECRLSDLCDVDLRTEALKMKVGEIRYGKLLRFYTPRDSKEDDKGASLSVAYRAKTGIYLLGLDYVHIRELLNVPSFPYSSKTDLLQAYRQGNYIYLVDSTGNIIAHPRYWNVIGVDRRTGNWRPTMRTDDDYGKRPINIRDYQSGKLTSYFDRLINVSFAADTVDIFSGAPTLGGAKRVLAVTPVFLAQGQFRKGGVFGRLVVGCSVEYYEEPKEKLVPYY